MKQKEQKIDLGMLKINHDVVASIARKAALEIDGVAAVKRDVLANVAALFSHHPRYHGVDLQINDGEVAIDMTLIIKYGVHIPEIAALVQENIRKVVEDMTGLIVTAVNVNIADVQTEAS